MIARWIYEESDNPLGEIEWLLKVVYTDREPNLTFKEDREDVLNEIKEENEDG